MQRWFSYFAACGLSAVMVSGLSAQIQIQIQVQAQPVPIQPGNVVLGDRVAGPMIGTPSRFANVDAVLVGRVVAFEPMDIEAAPAKGQPKVSYRIAVIQVTDGLHGVKKDTQTVRVGFQVNGNIQPGVIGGGAGGIQIQPAINGRIVRRPFGPLPTMNLAIGQDGLFFLAKHPTENFYNAPHYNGFVNRQDNPNFDNEVKSTKQICKVMADPIAALKGADKTDRYTAAAVQIGKYRTNTTGLTMKQEAISAEESKLILKALAEGDWAVGRFNQAIPSPFELFTQLGIGANDGYNPLNGQQQAALHQAMQKWLSENADKYVIKKLVVDPNAKAPPVTAVPVPAPIARPGVRIQPLPVPAPAPAPEKN